MVGKANLFLCLLRLKIEVGVPEIGTVEWALRARSKRAGDGTFHPLEKTE